MEDNKRHILVIPSWYPKDTDDISGSFFREQAIALSKYGYTVGVINPQLYTFRNTKETLQTKFGLNIINDNGVRTIRFNYLNLTPRVDFLIRFLWIKIGLYLFEIYLKKFGKPDIIHVHSMRNAGYLAFEISKKYNIPYVLTEHSTAFAKKLVKNKELGYLENIVRGSSYNIAVSHQFKELLNQTFQSSCWNYIPNMVKQEFLSYRKNHVQNKFIFLCVCNLITNKSVNTLIRAFAIYSNYEGEAVLNIAGEGPERSYLEILVKKLGLESKVKFLGSLTREQVKIEMSQASVFVLPSIFETFGVVIIEALAMGLPVIGTRCGGPESIIIDKVGILVEPGSVSQLAQAMINIYTNYQGYYSKDIKEYCENKFSEKAVISELTKIYDNV